MRSYVVLTAEKGALSLCDKTTAIFEEYFQKGETIVKVVHCAKHYGAALFSSGRLLLLAPRSPTQHGIIIENGDGHVRDVAAGDTHIVFCKEEGTVFSFGYGNKYGQLGDGTVWGTVPTDSTVNEVDALNENESDLPRLSTPQMICGFGYGKNGFEEGEICEGKRLCVPIVAVACGANHTLLLTTSKNSVYACGLGSSGQLGGRRRPLLQPSFKSIRLLFGLPINQVAAAGNHSFVLLQTGRLFAFGDNTCGQLGSGSTKAVGTPKAVRFGSSGDCDNLRKLDSNALKSLRPAWGSAESMFFPLRVERLSPELDPGEPFILSVWCSSTMSVVLTKTLDWLSCGLPLSRSPFDLKNPSLRMDRYGPLGRWIKRKEEAFVFRRMQWSERVATALTKSFPSVFEQDGSLDDVLSAISVTCSGRAVTLLIREAGDPRRALLFVQGEIPCAFCRNHEGEYQLDPVPCADRPLQNNEEDGSLEYILEDAKAIIGSEMFQIVV